MISKNNLKEAEIIMNSVIEKCWQDTSFKNQLLSSPTKTLSQFSGKKLNVPDGVTLIVNDQTDKNTIYINIPAKVDISNLELTDEQLELISGGLVTAIVLGTAGLTLAFLVYVFE